MGKLINVAELVIKKKTLIPFKKMSVLNWSLCSLHLTPFPSKEDECEQRYVQQEFGAERIVKSGAGVVNIFLFNFFNSEK